VKSGGPNLLAQELHGARHGLVAVHTMTCATRLLPVYLALTDGNPHVTWTFTVAPDDYNEGVPDFLARKGFRMVGWKKLVEQRQKDFGVVLAAASGGLHKLQIPVVRMAHGALFDKYTTRRNGTGVEATRQRHGLGAESVERHGRAIATRLVLAHEDDVMTLDPTKMGLLDSARVMGDPLVDQIDAHLHLSERYQRELDVGPGMKLVVVSSTAGKRCLWLDRPDLFRRLVSELPPDRYRVVVVLHPNLWHSYGRTAVLDMLRTACANGVRVVVPEDDWIVPIIAAHWVLADHGSALHYAARTNAALLTVAFSHDDVASGSARDELGRQVPALVWNDPIEPQLLAAAQPNVMARYASAGSRLSSQPGRFAANMRREVHEILGISEPSAPASLPELVVPRLITRSSDAWSTS
jgi:hypothetical protein